MSIFDFLKKNKTKTASPSIAEIAQQSTNKTSSHVSPENTSSNKTCQSQEVNITLQTLDPTALDLLEQREKGELDDIAFLSAFCKTKIFYSTPFGDHKDGGQRVFLIPGPNNTGYNPVFSTQERLIEFYENAGRVGYIIMNNEFGAVVKTTKSVNLDAPVKMGIIIDPGYFGLTLDVPMLDNFA